MTTFTETPFKTGSHYVSFAGAGNGGKEEIWFYFLTTLPRSSTPTKVTVSASRYVTASWGADPGEWTDWRTYVTEAREVDSTNYGPTVNLTDPRRKFLNETVLPLATAWLDSDEYEASRAAAHTHALVRLAKDLKGYSDPASGPLRRALATYGSEVSDETYAKLLAVADSYDAYNAALVAVTETDA